jgi:short subunit dehydrogenase-like uncharacterized protein
VNDIVVFGATGFVGRLVAGYLAGHAPGNVRIALAGRSPDKLERTREQLGRAAADWPLVVADSSDPASLTAMAAGARVVATTVGPYRRGGLALVDACIAEGAHYADLTGEVLFAHDSVQRHDQAAELGVRIVHSCGFDSIPSDLGVLLLHQQAGQLGATTLVVAALKGGFSGGTLASMKGQIDDLRSDRAARRVLADPYALSPGHPRSNEPGLKGIKRDPEHGWIGPFVMASYNTRIVRRSHFLLDYGQDFRRSPPPPVSARSAAVSRSSRAASCWTACCRSPARGRARTPAGTGSSGWRSTARATAPPSPPRAIRATPRQR